VVDVLGDFILISETPKYLYTNCLYIVVNNGVRMDQEMLNTGMEVYRNLSNLDPNQFLAYKALISGLVGALSLGLGFGLYRRAKRASREVSGNHAERDGYKPRVTLKKRK
jgi:hypothetical protein